MLRRRGSYSFELATVGVGLLAAAALAPGGADAVLSVALLTAAGLCARMFVSASPRARVASQSRTRA